MATQTRKRKVPCRQLYLIKHLTSNGGSSIDSATSKTVGAFTELKHALLHTEMYLKREFKDRTELQHLTQTNFKVVFDSEDASHNPRTETVSIETLAEDDIHVIEELKVEPKPPQSLFKRPAPAAAAAALRPFKRFKPATAAPAHPIGGFKKIPQLPVRQTTKMPPVHQRLLSKLQ